MGADVGVTVGRVPREATRTTPDDRFGPFYARAKREGWGNYEIDSSHNPHITTPVVLADLLDRIAV